ncbi:MAG: phosphotransferase, partial [Roseiflexaceae bacterium]|nr:phosphotransferase [Roseiflexaceae bacterium]
MVALSPTDLRAAAAWQLGDIHAITPIPVGALNRSFVIDAASGRYVLRGYRYTERSPIEHEHDLIAFAHQRGVPTLMPVALPSGETLAVCDGLFYALFPFASGEQRVRGMLGAADAAAMGRCVGKIHQALRDFPHDRARQLKLQVSNAATTAMMDCIQQAINIHATGGDDEANTIEIMQGMRAYIERTPPPDQSIDTLPHQMLHGDYHERNIFFDQGEVSAVIDWEQALFAPRGWELLRTLVFVWDLALAESVAFLEAYQQVYPLPLTELDLAARWFAWSRGHNLWVYQAVYLEGNQRAR